MVKVLKHFIFYTSEGQTQDPNGEDTENLQILGFESGKDSKLALKKFLKENSDIKKKGFNQIICSQLSNDENNFYYTDELE